MRDARQGSSVGSLAGRLIVLTGGAHGIGRSCVQAYAAQGAQVAVLDRDVEVGQQVAEAAGQGAFAVECDVGDAQSGADAIAQVLHVAGRIDVLHNNAGISSPSRPLHKTSEFEWDELFRVNVKSVYLLVHAAYAAFREARGTILNTASMVGLIGQRDHAAYVATKGAMIALTKAMALDYAPDSIRVNAICPAGVWTPLLRQWVSEQADPSAMERYLNGIHPLGDCPEPDVIADAAVFLVSDAARFITGCILPVSGGAELGYRL